MKYFIIAGEASGDLHGANLIKQIKAQDKEAEFRFWGGDLMANESDGLLMHYNKTTIMGFVEVVANLNSIFNNLKTCKTQILTWQPDVVVLIDYPGFNLRIAQFCKKQGIKTIYYIAPKIWAWKESRGKLLEKYVDELLIIFPFEVNYFKKWKVQTTYVGNPLIDAINQYPFNPNFVNQYSITKPIIALMPGSRKQELKRMLPKMMLLKPHFPDYEFVICGAPGFSDNDYKMFNLQNTPVIFGKTYDVLKNADAALVCSGTATLETALIGTPQVCGYVANSVSYHIAKLLVKIKYISLVNLCLNKAAIAELIQNDFNTETVINALNQILPKGAGYTHLIEQYSQLKQQLKPLENQSASQLAATRVINMAKM